MYVFGKHCHVSSMDDIVVKDTMFMHAEHFLVRLSSKGSHSLHKIPQNAGFLAAY